MGELNLLAFDLGAESGRAMVGTLRGGRLELAEKHRFANPNGKVRGHFYWNVIAQWEELKSGLRKAAAGGAKIDGIGIDTWGVDFGLLDGEGELIGNPFMYRDSRTDGMMERAFAVVPREKVFATTGIQFMQLNTLFQLLSMKGSAALGRAERLLFMPDLLNYLFSGVAANEFSIATTSQMYDPRARDWARPMLEALGLPTRMLGRIVESGTVLGAVTADVAAECGSGQIPVIAPGCHDTASAVAAVPAEGGADWAYISSGTWSLMGVELGEPVINEKSLKYNYTNEGGVGGRIRFLKNIMGLWLVQECRRQWAREGEELNYVELTQMAREAKAFGSLVNPEYGAFLTPGDMPAKIVEYCRKTEQATPKTKGEFVRCCLESLALTYRKTLVGLEDILGRRLSTLHIVGGGGQNELLNQMTADACGRVVVTGPTEATAMGNILTQAMALGALGSVEEVRRVVRASSQLKTYQPEGGGAWDTAWRRYELLW